MKKEIVIEAAGLTEFYDSLDHTCTPCVITMGGIVRGIAEAVELLSETILHNDGYDYVFDDMNNLIQKEKELVSGEHKSFLGTIEAENIQTASPLAYDVTRLDQHCVLEVEDIISVIKSKTNRLRRSIVDLSEMDDTFADAPEAVDRIDTMRELGKMYYQTRELQLDIADAKGKVARAIACCKVYPVDKDNVESFKDYAMAQLSAVKNDAYQLSSFAFNAIQEKCDQAFESAFRNTMARKDKAEQCIKNVASSWQCVDTFTPEDQAVCRDCMQCVSQNLQTRLDIDVDTLMRSFGCQPLTVE